MSMFIDCVQTGASEVSFLVSFLAMCRRTSQSPYAIGVRQIWSLYDVEAA
jgi:hypothetical protein